MALGFGVNLKARSVLASRVVGKTVKGLPDGSGDLLLEGSGDLLLHRSRLLEFRRGVREESYDIAKVGKWL